MDPLKLFLFGAPRLERDGKPIELNLAKAMALLAYLAVTKQAYSRDALATLFWPDHDQSSARASLRRTLYTLSKATGEGLLAAGPETVSLAPHAGIWLDVDVFSNHVRDCCTGAESGELAPECLARLAEAARLYSNDLLAGFTLKDSPAFDEWQFFEAEKLRQSLARVLVQLVQVHETHGEFGQAIGYARRRLDLDNLHEPAHRKLMLLYNQSGQPAAALRQYQQCCKILDQELHLAPQPETSALYESIRLGRELAPSIETFARPATRYVRSGDVHIAYQVLGNGPVDILFVGGWLSHVEQMWEEPDLARFNQRLATFSRLIFFDKRGVGLSDRVGYAPSLENTVDDILAVLDAVGSERAVLFGVSEGGTSSALFAATHPQRVLGLILYGTLAKGTKSADYPWVLTSEQYGRWLEQMMASWGQPVNLELFAPSRAEDKRIKEWWAKSLRLASSPGAVRAVLEVLRDIDVRVVLPAIRAPSLVLHRTGDRAIRVGNGRYIASQIPRAQYVELPGEDHWWWVGDAERLLHEIETFLKNLKHTPSLDRVLATILVIGFASNVKPDMRPLDGQITRLGGRVIDRSDNQLTIMFQGPSRALQCASAIGMLAQQAGLSIRAGVNIGECELDGSQVKGSAIQVAREIMERADPAQVLVSNTVKDLAIGSGFQFKKLDKGLPGKDIGEMQLHVVSNKRVT